MQTVTLSDNTLEQLRQAAAMRGVEASVYAEELLRISLAILHGDLEAEAEKTHSAREFSAIAPTRRSATEINAELEASRAEWEAEIPQARIGEILPE